MVKLAHHIFITNNNHPCKCYLFATGFLDLLAHPCRYISGVCFLQQLLCFFVKRNRTSVHLLPAMKRYVVFRQNAVHISDRYACGSDNLCNGCFLFIKFDNLFFCLCHHYFVLMVPTVLAGAVLLLTFNPKLNDVFSVNNVRIFKLTIFIVVHL